MTIRKLFPLLFVAVAVGVSWNDFGLCLPVAGATDAETVQLEETLAAIKERRSIPADGPFAYLKQGEDFVVRRKCDGTEMGRVAIAEVGSVRIGVGG